jgi:hypothetical protein
MNTTSLAMSAPIKFQTAPLFAGTILPFKRQALGGYQVGDLVWLSDLSKPGHRRKGRVANILHKFHVLVIIAQNPDAVVEVNPLVHGAMLAKRSGAQP